MASTSTSSVPRSFKYDVFLSFRGEDTRNNFVSHLYKALVQNGIQTYKDDEKIEKGETIDTQLIKSIEDSRFYIIVFSKNYASSSWCLDELVKIMECRKASEQTAYPVFYDVEPTEIRKQSGAVGKAFEKHENKEAAGKWREALKEAADLAGWELKKTANGDEAKLIQIVVANIFKNTSSLISSVDGNLVGMEMRVKEVLSSLELGTEDVRMIGIKGIGDGGKTTLATAIFNQISHQFEGSSFVENVREVSKYSLTGLKELHKQILTDIFSDQDITVSSVPGGINKMVQMMHRRKVLVVLDDVNDTKQLEALAGASNWFKPGSRVIITTRDEQVLLAHRVNYNHNFIHDVNLLSPKESIFLFSRYAFGRGIPVEGYAHLSRKVVEYAAGLPLTIKVLGSFLCDQKEPEWNDALERLKTIPLNETMMILELSYNSLEEDYKDIFLDVACLFKGWYKKDVIRVLESCGFRAINGLRVLEQKSLITISKDGQLGMHDHIKEMGMNIVRRLNPNEPERHSRLWIEEEIVDILTNNMGTQATECLKLVPYGLTSEISMKGLANMKKLRYLHLHNPGWYILVSNWNFDSLYLSNALRFMRLSGYPLSSLPKTFQAQHLVGLEMEGTDIVQLWDYGEQKVFSKLRFLEIGNSSKLKTLDLNMAPNLETLKLDDCSNMVELQIPGKCHKLVNLELSSLWLTTLHLGIAPNLETLRIKDCFDMVELQIPAECPKLVTLDLKRLKLTTLNLGITPNLETLSLMDCTDMVELHMPAKCPKLVDLNLSDLKLTTLHLGITPNLETLYVDDCTDMVELHMPAECQNLVNLDLNNLKLRTFHLGITPNLERLTLYKCTDMVEFHMPVECPKLVNLDLNNLKLRTFHLGITPNLEWLTLYNCTDMVEFHMPVECPKLVTLYLNNLKFRILQLGITPNLKTLSLDKCTTDMIELHMPTECPKLSHLNLSNLKLRTLDLGLTPNLKELILKNCYDLEEINPPVGCLKKLVWLSINGCRRFKLNKFVKEFDSQSLRKLAFEGGSPDVPKDLDRFICLEELTFSFTAIKNLPDSICKLKHLKSLEFIACYLLEKLPADIGRLQCLEKLSVLYCIRIEELPEEIGCLENLKELDITGTSITRLPKSFYESEGLKISGPPRFLDHVPSISDGANNDNAENVDEDEEGFDVDDDDEEF